MCIYACTCVYLLFMCVCVCGRQGMKETVRNWMVRVHWGCISILGCGFAMKNSFRCWTFPHVWETDLDLIWPLCAETHPYKNMPSITALSFSPWTCIFLRISNNWHRGGNIEWPTAHWAGSSLKVIEESIWPEGCQFEFLNRLALGSLWRKSEKVMFFFSFWLLAVE